jgi:hypothetical protein
MMVTMEGPADFYQDDEPVEQVRRAFEQGEKHLTAAPFKQL